MKKRITETLLGLLAFVCCLPMMAQQVCYRIEQTGSAFVCMAL